MTCGVGGPAGSSRDGQGGGLAARHARLAAAERGHENA